MRDFGALCVTGDYVFLLALTANCTAETGRNCTMYLPFARCRCVWRVCCCGTGWCFSCIFVCIHQYNAHLKF